MYKFIVRRSRSWVTCLVSKVEMFLPADVLARCSWHKSGLCSVYCLIGKVLPHLQKQVIRKLVIINRQFKLTQRKSKTHSKTFLWRFRVLLLRRWEVKASLVHQCKVLREVTALCGSPFFTSSLSYFLPFCKAHRLTLRSCEAESVQIRRANYKTRRKSSVWLRNAGRSADATTRERNMTFFFSFFLLFLITNRSDGVNVEKVAQCFSATPWKTLRQSAE